MRSDMEKEKWTVDQLTKSQFFHHKLHEWGLLEIAYELESVKGEDFDWDLKSLNIAAKAWDKVIHKGIKPVRVFAHPEVLKQNPKMVGYYRMFAMVSQKSMARVGLSVQKYEYGRSDLDDSAALEVSEYLNRIVSILIESDEKIDEREFDLWRGMAAGSQAQGSWGNTKGDRAEVVVKDLVERRVKERALVFGETSRGRSKVLELNDGRILVLGTEPDVGIYRGDKLIQIAIEIKGGIDPAAVLERFGAPLKSLRRAKQENDSSITILIMQGISLTPRVKEEINNSRNAIDHFFTIADVIGNDDVRKHLFTIMRI